MAKDARARARAHARARARPWPSVSRVDPRGSKMTHFLIIFGQFHSKSSSLLDLGGVKSDTWPVTPSRGGTGTHSGKNNEKMTPLAQTPWGHFWGYLKYHLFGNFGSKQGPF